MRKRDPVQEIVLKLEGLPEGHQDRAQLLPLRQKEVALHQEKAALHQKDVELAKQKTLRMQAAAAVQQPGAASSVATYSPPW
mmetsp:Transcript_31602/g.94218  ORF Transcript_31602/g.94218 Transcript_31602/m.94218 type:complete len:82 (-) Transcript_31602:998-1243(-)